MTGNDTEKTEADIRAQIHVLVDVLLALERLAQVIHKPGGRKAIKQAERFITAVNLHIDRIGD